jgi:hypothetical protein
MNDEKLLDNKKNGPTVNKYYRLKYLLSFDEDLHSQKLNEFLDYVDDVLGKVNKSHLNEIKTSKALELLIAKNNSDLNFKIKNLCQYLNELNNINGNFFMNLTYQLNIDLIKRLQLTANTSEIDRIEKKEAIMAILNRCKEFFDYYSFQTYDIPHHIDTPIKNSISKNVITKLRDLLYDIYLNMFCKRNKENLYIYVGLIDNCTLCIKFSDDICNCNILPEWIKGTFTRSGPKLLINLKDFGVHISLDERIIRNRKLRFENQKKIDELQNYLDELDTKATHFTKKYNEIKESKMDDCEKLSKLFILVSESYSKCPDKTIKTNSQITTKITELETIDKLLANENMELC